MKKTDWQLRPLMPTDLALVTEISSLGGYSDWGLESFASCFKENYYGWVISVENRVCAFLLVLIKLDEIEILNLGVHPLKQRQGLAGHLLEHLIEFARHRAISHIHLEVSENNLAAIALYKKHGFEFVGCRKNYYAAKEGACDALLFSRKLVK